MSSNKRKISHWILQFVNAEERNFDSKHFLEFFEFLKTVSDNEKLDKDNKNNKAVMLSSVRKEERRGKVFLEVIFKSCKFNHSPDYMSSEDGTERPTDKKLNEGDKELTHLLFLVKEEEAYILFEERRNGVSLSSVLKYLNQRLKIYFNKKKVKERFKFEVDLVLRKDFLEDLKSMKKISVAEVFVDKELVGSDFLNLMEIDDSYQQTMTMTLKANRGGSLSSYSVKNFLEKFVSGGSKISRVRLRGKNINKMSMTIDTLDGKKSDEVYVDLDANGVVESLSIFEKMKEIIICMD